MRALCLLVVLVLAKLLVIAGTGAPPAGWASLAYFWQDALVALLAGALDAALRRPRIGWAFYAAFVSYIALGVPVAVVLGTPMTWAILQAARGPLADSIAYYVTAANLVRIAVVVAAGAVLPIALMRVGVRTSAPVRKRWRAVAVGIVAAGVIAGRVSASQIELRGLDRNAVTALVPVALPHVVAPAVAADWRESPFADPSPSAASAGTLSRFRGSAKGFNVLVVILESTAAQYLRPYGGVSRPSDDPMSTVTALADRAILFENAYVTYPESIKGLFSTFCSRYPAFGVSPEDLAAMPCAPLAAQLAAAGYRTALFHSGRFDYLGMNAVVARLGFGLSEDAAAIGGVVHSSFGVDEPATVDRVLRWIDSTPERTPFFATYVPIAGHHPYATPTAGPFPEDSEFARYRNALHYGDEALATLLAGLRARGLDRDTVLVVFGDHGEAFGQHPGNIGHTLFINEENVRVPYLIAIPGASTRPTRVADVVSLIDTAPTLLEILDLPVPGVYQGTSLLHPGSRMALMFTDYSLGLLGLRDGCWKYGFEINSGRSTLFDLCRDPRETDNRAAFHADRVTAYRDRVAQWGAAQRAFVNSPPPG
jgi:arylsulfatase A-like enzyme